MPATTADPSIYQLKITLLDIEPPIWRRIRVPSSMLLCCLHHAFQAVMGWTDSHLHQFEIEGKYWGVPENDGFGDLDITDESEVPVEKLLLAGGDSMVYVYDFGDDWRHQVVLEKIIPLNAAAMPRPVCLAGRRRCPPEDIGGPLGYEKLLSAMVAPEGITVKELSEKMNVKVSMVVKKLMDRSILATINQKLDFKLATEIASEFGEYGKFDRFGDLNSGTFRAEEFDVTAVNDILNRMCCPKRHGQ